jgi:hypothetical protein
MPSALRVACDDAAVLQRLRAWLDGMRLEPPRPLTLAIAIADAILEAPDDRDPFLQPQVEIRAGPPHGDVRVRSLSAPASAVLTPGSDEARVTLTRDALDQGDVLERGFLTVVLACLLRRVGWHHVHAATARDPRGRDWLFAGNSGCGKSTTAALLATRGWGIGGDDLTFLTLEGGHVDAIAQHAPIALRPGGADLLGRDRTFRRRSGGFSTKDGRKTAFLPEDLGCAWLPRTRPTVIMLPRVGAARTRLTPVPSRHALAELVRWSALVAVEPDLAQAHLDLLAHLVRQTDSWRLDLGPDLFDGRDLLMELLP